MNLSSKVALITGGSRGIGRACALALAEAGADVAVNYLKEEDSAREVCDRVNQSGHRCITIQADVSRSAEVARMVARVEEDLGKIDIVVNNAGISRRLPLDKIREEDWDELIDVNLKSAFLVTQAVLPGMRARRWGRIINISSVAAQNGGVVGPHYAASKGGMIGMTHAYASFLVKEGITANAIAPALIETDMTPDSIRSNPSVIPVGRLGTVEEIADVVVMLVKNGYMTGQTISVNGGWYMTS